MTTPKSQAENSDRGIALHPEPSTKTLVLKNFCHSSSNFFPLGGLHCAVKVVGFTGETPTPSKACMR